MVHVLGFVKTWTFKRRIGTSAVTADTVLRVVCLALLHVPDWTPFIGVVASGTWISRIKIQ